MKRECRFFEKKKNVKKTGGVGKKIGDYFDHSAVTQLIGDHSDTTVDSVIYRFSITVSFSYTSFRDLGIAL